jgi:hypothetical protein
MPIAVGASGAPILKFFNLLPSIPQGDFPIFQFRRRKRGNAGCRLWE